MNQANENLQMKINKKRIMSSGKNKPKNVNASNGSAVRLKDGNGSA